MTNYLCMRCGAGLTGDAIALHKKLISRSAEEFLCLDCQAEDYGAAREDLERLIDYFHRTGICLLFARYE